MRYHLIPDCIREVCLARLVPRFRRRTAAHRGPLRSIEHRYRAYRICMEWKVTEC